MARNTAQQGAAFERRVIADLAGDGKEHPGYGYLCLRAAASKGAADIVAASERDVLAIQCKLTDPAIGPAERERLNNFALLLRAAPVVAWWAKSETTGLKAVHYRRLTGDGPKDWVPWAPGEDD